jgi:tRNA (cmo5U34)-methyltransferase
MSQIQNKFDEISKKYDSQRRSLIPCFDDFYDISISVADVKTNTPQILDIGAGTGLLSYFLLNRYPEARITLIDISEKMLEVARQRLSANENIKYVVGDYTKINLSEEFDMVVSALSIHHLEDSDKKELLKKCYSVLKPNGIFINADQVMGETPYIDSFNKKRWKESIEKSGLPREEILSAYERMKLDKETTLKQQLEWFTEIGLKDVSCIYKYYNFTVMFGRK